ncbi:MAG: hypothetical protein VYD53_12590 [Pseudomonadota bacterium]|nr:hypothetical protein [Pseudomonadota bacterium]
MTGSDWLGVAGLIVGIAGLAYAVYENRSKARLSDYIRAQNWHIYSKANNANGSVQLALQKYKQEANQVVDLEAFEWLSKADAFGQDVFKDVIRQIQVSEPSFTVQDVERWVGEKRVSEKHAPLFYALTPANKSHQPTAKAAAE